jgi:hypothetical protein
LHLLQNCRTRISPGCRRVDLYCIRRGAAGANKGWANGIPLGRRGRELGAGWSCGWRQ